MTGASVDLPEGPVTIMFTDIVGSTALRTTLGDQEADRLCREHDGIVRAQIEAHGGHDQAAALGDGFLALFVSTRRALAAAIGIQRELDSFNRSRPGPALKVRIGLNTGEVVWADGQLSGETVHAASRVCAVADGGQILVSDVTRQLVGTVPDVSFADTGEHDLKGFPHPWRLWEVVWVRETATVPPQVFVGRDEELAYLRGKLDEALAGRGGCVLIGGEPGVGKTTLVRQLIRDAEARGALALFGRCYEIEGAVPYSPFVEMLEQGLVAMPADIVREDMGDDAPEVARMVPELRRRFPDIPPPLDLPPEQQRRYFFNAVRSFIARGSTRFPLLLVMDDVHWADVSTLLLIEHVAEICPELRVLGVGTYRDVELDVTRPLAASIERMLRNRTVERLAIKRFDRTAVARMVEALAGRTPPEQLVDAICAETEGNPFFVDEVFRHLVEEGRVFDHTGAFRDDVRVDELDVPESVRLVVGRRLERLGADAQKALAAGAVVGRGFPFAMLEEISGVDPGRLLDIVEEAEAARVIVPEDRGGEIHYAFGHELIRQTLLSSLSLLRRQRLHLAVADAMTRRQDAGQQVPSSEVAHHLLQAGGAPDSDRTLRYLERAADEAMQSAAFEEALRAIDDALALIGDKNSLRRARLRERQGLVARAFGRFEECLEIWRDVVEVYAQHDEFDAAGELCWQIGYQLVWLTRFDEAFAIYARGIEILRGRRSVATPALIGSTGLLTGFAGMYAEARTQLAEAERVAAEAGDVRNQGRVGWATSLVEWSFARPEDSVLTGQQGVARLRAVGDLWTLTDALCWLAFPLTCLGRLDEGEAAASEAFELSQRLGHVAGELLARRGLILAQAPRAADLDAVERAVRKDLELCVSIGSPWQSQSYAWLAIVHSMRGDCDEGLDEAERAIVTEPASAFSGIGWAGKAFNRSYAGDVQAVEKMVLDALDVLTADTEQVTLGSYVMLLTAAEACAAAELRPLVETLYPVLARHGDRFVFRTFDWALIERVNGMVASCIQDWDRAARHYAAARRQVASLPNLLDAPQVDLWEAKMLLDRGRPEDRNAARAMLTRAHADLQRIGVRPRAALAEHLLGRV